jgi:hypothetical protein
MDSSLACVYVCGLLQGTGINRGGLFIKQVQFYHAGQYRCIVKSSTDEFTQSAILTVIGMRPSH